MLTAPQVTGVILAGGQGSRVGGADKGLLPLDGVALERRVADRLGPQVGSLLVSANRNAARHAALLGCAVVADDVPGHAGPLAGMLAGLEHAATGLVVFVPCDLPFLPLDLVARLQAGLQAAGTPAALASAGGRRHPVVCLCHRSLRVALRDYLNAGGRRVGEWLEAVGATVVEFPEAGAFANFNRPEDFPGGPPTVVSD